jgi:hypothetical protein
LKTCFDSIKSTNYSIIIVILKLYLEPTALLRFGLG